MTKSEGRRKRLIIPREDEKRIFSALERLAKTNDFEALRLRAMVYFLWDGAVTGLEALAVNIEEVVVNPDAQRSPRIVAEVAMRPCDANRHKARKFFISERVRGALLDYLRVARADDKIRGNGFRGPLFASVRKIGYRISRHTALGSWRAFLADVAKIDTEYGLDDVVGTGRTRFIESADGNAELLAEHAGITVTAAAMYQQAPVSSTRDILRKMGR